MIRRWPAAIRALDVSQPISMLSGLDRHATVRFFVMDGPELLGSFDVPLDGAEWLSAARIREALADALAWTLVKRDLRREFHVVDDQRIEPRSFSISIVVATADRPEDLRNCLRSVFLQRTRHSIEVVVVDNRPGGSSTPAVAAEFPGVRLVQERRPGLSYARNAGILHASGEIVVATDDDVVAPPHWIEWLVRPFARPDVAAVTGHVLPVELETEAQWRFEAYGGLGKGFERREATGAWFRERRVAVPTWELGATANAAFRATIFKDPRIGLLDEALGAGMPTGCSEDTDLFYRILKAGHTIVYEPSAYVWHRHRTTMQALRRQIYAYSKGHVAYHLTTLLRDGDRRALVRLAYSLPKAYARRAWQWVRGSSDYPPNLIAVEILGNLAGPWALLRSRQRVRRLGRSGPAGLKAGPTHDAQGSRPAGLKTGPAPDGPVSSLAGLKAGATPEEEGPAKRTPDAPDVNP